MAWIVWLFLGLVVVGGIVLYNHLAQLRVTVDSAWSDVDVQLKRRHDLVPNLVNVVKGYASHEQRTFEAVVAARQAAITARTPEARQQAEAALGLGLGNLFALAENYPDLKAATGFTALQHQLAAIEDALQNARRYYNAVVRDFNTRLVQFPSNLVAAGFGFRSATFFRLDGEAERQVPNVQFPG